MSYNWDGKGIGLQDRRPGYPDRHQHAIIDQLEKRIAQLEGQAKSKGSGRMPGLKSKADGKPAQPRKPRQRRSHGFARTRMTPTHRVEHVVKQCPDCGTGLSGRT